MLIPPDYFYLFLAINYSSDIVGIIVSGIEQILHM